MFVTVYSNTQSMPACQIVALEPAMDFVQPVPLAFLVEPASGWRFFLKILYTI